MHVCIYTHICVPKSIVYINVFVYICLHLHTHICIVYIYIYMCLFTVQIAGLRMAARFSQGSNSSHLKPAEAEHMYMQIHAARAHTFTHANMGRWP